MLQVSGSMGSTSAPEQNQVTVKLQCRQGVIFSVCFIPSPETIWQTSIFFCIFLFIYYILFIMYFFKLKPETLLITGWNMIGSPWNGQPQHLFKDKVLPFNKKEPISLLLTPWVEEGQRASREALPPCCGDRWRRSSQNYVLCIMHPNNTICCHPERAWPTVLSWNLATDVSHRHSISILWFIYFMHLKSHNNVKHTETPSHKSSFESVDCYVVQMFY